MSHRLKWDSHQNTPRVVCDLTGPRIARGSHSFGDSGHTLHAGCSNLNLTPSVMPYYPKVCWSCSLVERYNQTLSYPLWFFPYPWLTPKHASNTFKFRGQNSSTYVLSSPISLPFLRNIQFLNKNIRTKIWAPVYRILRRQRDMHNVVSNVSYVHHI